MFEDLNIDDLDFLGERNQNDMVQSEHNQSEDDDFYHYSNREKSEIYSDLKNLSQDELSKKLDVEAILKYNNELRKQNEFKLQQGLNSLEIEDYNAQTKENFRDYLVYRNISGKRKGLFYQNIIPQERIQDSGEKVEVFDDLKYKESLEKDKSTVIVHKTKSGDVELIEILCSCGKKTYIKLDYNGSDASVIYSDGEHFHNFEGVPQNNNEEIDEIIENNEFGITGNFTEDFNYEDLDS